jgi:hypothetical protein
MKTVELFYTQRKSMKKIFIVFGLLAAMITLGLGSSAKVMAQLTAESNSAIAQTIDVTDKSALDRGAFRPEDRDESSSPYDTKVRATLGRKSQHLTQ